MTCLAAPRHQYCSPVSALQCQLDPKTGKHPKKKHPRNRNSWILQTNMIKYDQIRFQVSGFGKVGWNIWHVLACSGMFRLHTEQKPDTTAKAEDCSHMDPCGTYAMVGSKPCFGEHWKNEQKWTEMNRRLRRVTCLKFANPDSVTFCNPSVPVRSFKDLTRSKAPKSRLAQFRSELGI